MSHLIRIITLAALLVVTATVLAVPSAMAKTSEATMNFTGKSGSQLIIDPGPDEIAGDTHDHDPFAPASLKR
jgi:hypothetical protein